MNILFVTDYYYPHIGGVEKLFEQLSTRLAANGHRVDYITWRYNKQLPCQDDHHGVNVTRIDAPNRTIFPLFALRQILKQSREADLIHTSTYSSAIGVWLTSLFVRRKTIVTVHEVWGKLWNDLPFLSKTEKWLFRIFESSMLSLKFSQYVAVSDSTRTALLKRGINASKVTRIYNGIDYDLPVWETPSYPFTFVYFGRAGVSKGLDLLMDAAQIIAEKNADVRFRFIVSSQDKRVLSRLKHEIEASNLKEISELFQNIPYEQLLNKIKHSHCVIIPSYSEGFGFSAAEASAMEVPLISSGRGALPEVVSGKVIEMNTFSVDDLVEAMEKALRGEFISVPAKQFSIDDFVNRHLELYRQLVD
jgi:D-inositol-3-phosphate glycosyltransferase